MTNATVTTALLNTNACLYPTLLDAIILDRTGDQIAVPTPEPQNAMDMATERLSSNHAVIKTEIGSCVSPARKILLRQKTI